MPRYFALLLIALQCGSCSTISDQERSRFTEFSIRPDRTFEFRADAVLTGNETIVTAPVAKEDWLKDWLNQNQMCPAGYVITDRRAVKAWDALFGQAVYKATYIGRCL